MLSGVVPHVDQVPGLADRPEGGLHHGLGCSGERHHRPVRCLSRVDVEQGGFFHGRDLAGDTPDDFWVTAFAEVGDTLD